MNLGPLHTGPLCGAAEWRRTAALVAEHRIIWSPSHGARGSRATGRARRLWQHSRHRVACGRPGARALSFHTAPHGRDATDGWRYSSSDPCEQTRIMCMHRSIARRSCASLRLSPRLCGATKPRRKAVVPAAARRHSAAPQSGPV